MDDQAVEVNIPLQGAPGDVIELQALGDRLAECAEAAGVGVFDGNLIGQDVGVLYLYGPDADRLWQAIEGVLRGAELPAGTYVVKQYGPPGEMETRVDL